VSVATLNPPSAGQPSHLLHLDGLRALLAIFVVMGHCHATIWPPLYYQHPMGYTALLTGWLTHAHLAVQVFIVLSGYCLMLPVARNGGRLRGFASSFYARRARRILPTFYAALTLNLLLILGPLGKMTGTHWDACLPVTWEAVAANAFMVQDLFERWKINHAFWSIAIEWRLYFLFPIVVWAFRRLGRWIAAGVFAITAMVIALQLPFEGAWWGVRETVSFFGLFVLGALAASRPQWEARPARSAALFATAIMLWQLSGWHCPMLLRRVPVQEFGTGVTAACWLAVWSSSGGSMTRRLLQWRPLPAIGCSRLQPLSDPPTHRPTGLAVGRQSPGPKGPWRVDHPVCHGGTGFNRVRLFVFPAGRRGRFCPGASTRRRQMNLAPYWVRDTPGMGVTVHAD